MRIGEYDVLGEIARGGAGVVYRARHASHGTPVAIKVLQLQSTPDFVERFRREAHVTFRLRHPHVVGLLEWGQHQGHPYLVLELIEGESLEDRLREKGPLPARQIYRIGRQIADALHYAHGMGLVHRDIKPANILVEAHSNRALLTDFGIAQVESSSAERLTITGEVLGTPAFMSPEQARGAYGEVGASSDVYSLGATLYAALCGRPPVTETAPIAAMAQVMTEAPDLPSDVYAAADDALTEIVMRCLEKEPGDRYANAAALRDALADASRVGTPGDTGAIRQVEVKRSSAPFALVGAVLLAVGVLLGGLIGRASAPAPTSAAVEPPAPSTQPDDDPAPQPATREAAIPLGWLRPYSTTLALQKRAAETQRWEDYVRLAEHFVFQSETQLGIKALKSALERVEDATQRVSLLFLSAKLKIRSLNKRGALEDAERILLLDPDSPYGHIIRGLALQDTGDLEGALESMQEAVSHSDDDYFAPRVMRASLYLSTQRTAETESEIDALLELGLSSTDLLKLQLAATRDPGTADALVERVAERQPDQAVHQRQLALTLYRRGDLISARESAARATVLEQSDYVSALIFMDVCLRNQDYQDAIDNGEYFIQRAPSVVQPMLRAQLALAYARQDPVANALRVRKLGGEFRELESPGKLVLKAMSRMLEARKDVLTSLRVLEKHDRYSPIELDPDLLGQRLRAHQIFGHCIDAHRDLTTILNRAPGRRGLMAQRGSIYLRQGLPRLATFMFQQQGRKDRGPLQATADLYAAAQLQLGRTDEARQVFRNPTGRIGSLMLARTLALDGDPDGALNALKRHNPDLPLSPDDDWERAAERLVSPIVQTIQTDFRSGDEQAVLRSLASLDALLLFDPGDVGLRMLQVQASSLLPRPEHAEQATKNLLRDFETEHTPELYGGLTEMIKSRRPALTVVLLNEVMRSMPKHTNASVSLAMAYLQLGLSPAAERVASEGLEHAPDTPTLLAIRGIARARQGKPGVVEELRAAQGHALLGHKVSLALAEALWRDAKDPAATLEAAQLAARSEQTSTKVQALVYLSAAQSALKQGNPGQTLSLVLQLLENGARVTAPQKRLLTETQRAVFGG